MKPYPLIIVLGISLVICAWLMVEAMQNKMDAAKWKGKYDSVVKDDAELHDRNIDQAWIISVLKERYDSVRGVYVSRGDKYDTINNAIKLDTATGDVVIYPIKSSHPARHARHRGDKPYHYEHDEEINSINFPKLLFDSRSDPMHGYSELDTSIYYFKPYYKMDTLELIKAVNEMFHDFHLVKSSDTLFIYVRDTTIHHKN